MGGMEWEIANSEPLLLYLIIIVYADSGIAKLDFRQTPSLIHLCSVWVL